MRISNWMMAACLSLFFVGNVNADLISEFQPNPEGTDPATTQIELWGTAGASLSLTFLTVEAEGAAAGTIDASISVSGSYDSNGLFVFSMNDFENPAFTAFLVSGFTGATGNDLDTNNDGVLDLTPWTAIEDSLNVPDGGSIGSGDFFYGSTSLTAGVTPFDDEPISVFRAGSNGAWYAVHENPDGSLTYGILDASGNTVDASLFDLDPTVNTSTFGSINPNFAIPEPSAFALLLVAGVCGFATRRRRI